MKKFIDGVVFLSQKRFPRPNFLMVGIAVLFSMAPAQSRNSRALVIIHRNNRGISSRKNSQVFAEPECDCAYNVVGVDAATG